MGSFAGELWYIQALIFNPHLIPKIPDRYQPNPRLTCWFVPGIKICLTFYLSTVVIHCNSLNPVPLILSGRKHAISKQLIKFLLHSQETLNRNNNKYVFLYMHINQKVLWETAAFWMDGRLLWVNLCKGKSISLLYMNEKVATFALKQAWLHGREAPQKGILGRTLVCNGEFLNKAII